MATEVTNYQCPACTGPMHFDGASGKLVCDYCGSTYAVAEVEAMYAKKEEKSAEAFEQAQAQPSDLPEGWDAASLQGDWGEDGAGMRAYTCSSCGAELICEESTAATTCPYCGNPSVIPGQLSGALKPDYVIPFKLDHEAAKSALRNHYKGKHFLPRAFARENAIEKIQGVYVPFWLFDGEAEIHVQFDGTQSRCYRSGDYEVTEIEHYRVCRDGTVDFEKIPVDASARMPDAHMDAIEPFDYGELKPFSTAYLPGFLADRYDVPVADCAARADERASQTALDAMRQDTQRYETCTVQEKEVKLHRGKVHYALLPVYMLHTKWKGKDYLFAMNGQTGRLIGDLPMSWGRYWAWFAGIAVPLTLILGFLFHLI